MRRSKSQNGRKQRLSDSQYDEIRKAYVPWDKENGMCALAKKYETTSSNISRIIHGK